MRNKPFCLLGSIWLWVAGASACVPADTRPPPAEVELFVSPNDVSQQSVTTADGWTVTIDRFLIGLGNASVDDPCIAYSDAHYARLLDARRMDDQKLATLFGLGQCPLRFGVTGPDIDTILGEGVSEQDALLQGFKGTDPYVMQEESAAVGMTATATRGSTIERINWSFRKRRNYLCQVPVDKKTTTPIDFPSDAHLTYHLVPHPEVLLRNDGDADVATLRFDPIASADMLGNADGEVTLDELRTVTIEEARRVGMGPYSFADTIDPTTINTLEDYVYLVLFPAIPAFRENIVCELRPDHHGPD